MNTINLIFNVFMTLIVLYLAFFKSYFKEKGKNLATKQDVGRITDIVERIKHKFDSDTEKIKQQLIFLNQKKITLISEERDSIIGFYQSYYKLLNQIMNFSIDTISEENPQEYPKINNLINTLQMAFDCSIGRLDLFFDSPEFIDAKKNLTINTINIKLILTHYLIYYKSAVEKIKIAEMASVSEEKQSEILRLISEKTDLTIKFYKDRLDAYKVLYNDISNVREILKKRIKLILTE
jgi:hypothetical protein